MGHQRTRILTCAYSETLKCIVIVLSSHLRLPPDMSAYCSSGISLKYVLNFSHAYYLWNTLRDLRRFKDTAIQSKSGCYSTSLKVNSVRALCWNAKPHQRRQSLHRRYLQLPCVLLQRIPEVLSSLRCKSSHTESDSSPGLFSSHFFLFFI